MIVLCRLYSMAGKIWTDISEKVNLQAYNNFLLIVQWCQERR